MGSTQALLSVLSVYKLRAKVRMVEQVLPVRLLQLTTHLPAGEELRQVDAPWAGAEGEDTTRDKKEWEERGERKVLEGTHLESDYRSGRCPDMSKKKEYSSVKISRWVVSPSCLFPPHERLTWNLNALFCFVFLNHRSHLLSWTSKQVSCESSNNLPAPVHSMFFPNLCISEVCFWHSGDEWSLPLSFICHLAFVTYLSPKVYYERLVTHVIHIWGPSGVHRAEQRFDQSNWHSIS